MKKPGPELGKDVSEVTSAGPGEQLNVAGEEKERNRMTSVFLPHFLIRNRENLRKS